MMMATWRGTPGDRAASAAALESVRENMAKAAVGKADGKKPRVAGRGAGAGAGGFRPS
jgi:hypothetical protein